MFVFDTDNQIKLYYVSLIDVFFITFVGTVSLT